MTDLPRRAWMVNAAALAAGMALLRPALAAGAVSTGVATVRGDVQVNGRRAERGMEVKPGDVVVTARDAQLVLVVDRDAFLIRGDTRIEFPGAAGGAVVTALRVVTGALLSVFAPRERREIRTSTATIGIRGTGVYVEAQRARSYVCTCYGVADLVPVDDPRQAQTVHTTHHDEPRYIYPKGMPRMVEKAPVIDHTDAELILLESLVGRRVPFIAERY